MSDAVDSVETELRLREELDYHRRRADVMSQLLAPAALELGLIVEYVEDGGQNYDTSDAKKIIERIGRLSKEFTDGS